MEALRANKMKAALTMLGVVIGSACMVQGATRREIRWQFLLEALIISGAGALIGILIAVSIPVAVRPFVPGDFAVSVSWLSVVVSFLVTCLTGVLFGYLPANRAAGLHPTESLCYE